MLKPIAVAATATVAVIGLAAPALASTLIETDPADTGHGSDLRRVKVDYAPDALTIVTKHTNLRRDYKSGSSGVVYIDTDPKDKGPEFVVSGGYFVGTDYSLLSTEGFAPKKWKDHVEGAFEFDIDYKLDKVTTVIPVETLGLDDDAKVRVAVKVGGTRKDGTSDGLIDWLGDRREFTSWVTPS